MLARAQRIRHSEDFRATIRAGKRAVRPTLVIHVVPGSAATTSAGFVVSKTVGPAVIRNKVKRRLRHISRQHLAQLPVGSRLIVRALPSAADASYAALESDFCRALAKSGVL